MPNAADPSSPETEATNEESLDSKINVAVRAQLKRELKPVLEQFKGLETTISQSIAKALEAKPPTQEQAPGSPATVSPELKLMQEKFEKLERSAAEDKAARVAVEERARKDNARSEIRTALDSKGIKGARANAIVALLEQSSALTFDENGAPILTVSRPRTKGGAAEPLQFDIAAGVEDWAKTADAAEFLPAPSAPIAKTVSRPGIRTTAPKFDGAALSDEEAARRTYAQLTAAGVNVDSILNE